MAKDIIEIARASYEAYVRKDRAAIEALIADDFHFTSPLDNRIDRITYFARCWPNSQGISAFTFIHLVAHEIPEQLPLLGGEKLVLLAGILLQPVAHGHKPARAAPSHRLVPKLANPRRPRPRFPIRLV